jgi:hypothetical protein
MAEGDIPEGVQGFIDAANAAQVTGDHAGRAQAASAALRQWSSAMRPTPSDKPTNGVEAAARLEHLQKDAGWRDRYFRGDAATVTEFNKLNEQVATASDADLALAGVRPTSSVDLNAGAVLAEHDMPAVAAHLRDLGHPEHHVSELMHGSLLDENFRPLPPDETERRVSNAELFITQAARDPDLRRKILSGGDAAALDVFQKANATIALGRRGGP